MKKVIVTVVDDCLKCPKFNTCKEISKLNPRQRFALKTATNISGILKTCPLPDHDESKDERIKELEKAAMELYDIAHESDNINHKLKANLLYDVIVPKESELK